MALWKVSAGFDDLVRSGGFEARLLHGFTGRFLVARACILVLFEVFDVRSFPNVFATLKSGFLPADPCLKVVIVVG